jgi:hypothetical protein
MSLRRLSPLLLALCALPAPAAAQTFGMSYAPPERASGGVTVEIRRDGAFFWSGRFELRSAAAPEVNLYARPGIRMICFAPQPGMPVGRRAEDSLSVKLVPDGRPDRFRLRLDLRVVRPAVPGLRGWDICQESLEQTEGVAFEGRVELAPGGRARIRAAHGFEAILTREADAPPPEQATPPARVPPPAQPVAIVNTDFEVRVERAGVLRWQGVLHQETVIDHAKTREEVFRPVLVPCRNEGRRAQCPEVSIDHWEIRLRDLNNLDRIDINFDARRSTPRSQVELADGGRRSRSESGSVSASLRVVLPRGQSTEIRADDVVVRVTRR